MPSLLFVVSVGAFAVCALLTTRWMSYGRGRQMRYWAVAFGLGGAGALLQALRGIIPHVFVVAVSNDLLILMMAMLWAGFRCFDRRVIQWPFVAAGPLVWLAACAYPPFYASFEARTILVSGLMAIYSAAIAAHVGRQHLREPLPSRPAIVILFATHVVIVLSRVPLLFVFPVAEIDGVIHSSWMAAYVAESVIHAFLVITAILAVARDRTEREFRRAAETDGLTGVANRRAFVAEAEAYLEQGRAGALLLIDIDHFKAINDTYGHQAGDQVLAGFAARATACLSGGDHLLGRIGGEEFAIFLPQTSPQAALERAEYLREAVAATAFHVGGEAVRITISVGVAPTGGGGIRFDRLFALADAALYRAKRAGRNRVRAHDPVPRRPSPSLHVIAS